MTERLTKLSDIVMDHHAYALVVISAHGIAARERDQLDRVWSECERGKESDQRLSFVYGTDARREFERLAEKNWDRGTKRRLGKEHQPLMLIVSGREDIFSRFEQFDPSKHHWYMLWFSRLIPKKAQTPKAFTRLIDGCRSGRLFQLLDRAVKARTNPFPMGCLTSRQNPPRRSGHPTYLDDRFGLRTKYDAIKERYRERGERVSQTAIFKEILKDRDLKDQLTREIKGNPTPKALMDAFRRARWL